VEELVKERNKTRKEIEDLKAENNRVTMEFQSSTSRSIAKEASEADTMLSLQKMIASLEEAKGKLEEELDHKDAELKLDSARIEQLESKLRASQEMNKKLSTQNSDNVGDGNKEEEAKLREEISVLYAANDSLQSEVNALQDEQAALEDELESYKSDRAESDKDLESITELKMMITQLQDSKNELEEEMNEATDAIAMLEDELDHKDAEVKELLMKLTMLQQQFSQVDKCKTALAERNAKLSSENDDMATQIKVLIIEKKVASEEIETMKAMKSIEEEDQQEAMMRTMEVELQKEMEATNEKLDQCKKERKQQVYKLEQQVMELAESNQRLEEGVDEGNDAIAILREALKELEEGKAKRDATIKELKAQSVANDATLRTVEATKEKLQAEHQVSVDTIATLQKMITSLETSKQDLEDELNASSAELIELREQLEGRSAAGYEHKVNELEGKLSEVTEKNSALTQRIGELKEANIKMKEQVKDLGESLAKVTMRNATMQGPDASLSSGASNARALVSTRDPVASCDALIAELKNQIGEIVSARNAALEEIEYLKSDGASVRSSRDGNDSASTNPSAKTLPPPADVSIVSSPFKKNLSNESLHDKALALPQGEPVDSEDDTPSYKTMEKSLRSSAGSSANQSGSRGSSLLEAAKKLCDRLDEKRTKEEMEKLSGNNGNGIISASTAAPKKAAKNAVESNKPMQWEEEPIKNVLDQDIDDNTSAKEVKEDSPKDAEKFEVDNVPSSPIEDENNPSKPRNTSRSKGRFDIDQLTSIYFEKCGMSVSRFSDLSSDSSSFRRRRKSSPNDATVSKKVKICRNGIFMGTYEGDLNPDGQRHGFGVLLCDNGNSYEGEWKKDKRDGLGIARYSSGDVYDGQWQRGKRQGHGVMYIEAGDTYIGSWDNGLKHGAGTYHWADGEVDVSWYQKDRRVGEGVRWNSSRSKAYRLERGTKKEELSLDEAYVTAEKLGLNLEKFDSGVP